MKRFLLIFAFLLTSCSPSIDFRMRMFETFITNGEHACAANKYNVARTMYEAALRQIMFMDRLDPRVIRTLVELGWACLLSGDSAQASLILEDAAARCEKAIPKLSAEDQQSLYLLAARAHAGVGDCQLASQAHSMDAPDEYGKAVKAFLQARLENRHGFDSQGAVLARSFEGAAQSQLMHHNESDALFNYKNAAAVSNVTAGALSLKKECRETYRHLLWLSGDKRSAETLEPATWRDNITHAREFEKNHEFDDAAFQYSEALDKAKEFGDSYTQVATLAEITEYYLRHNDKAEARKAITEALNIQRGPNPLHEDKLGDRLNALLAQCG